MKSKKNSYYNKRKSKTNNDRFFKMNKLIKDSFYMHPLSNVHITLTDWNAKGEMKKI